MRSAHLLRRQASVTNVFETKVALHRTMIARTIFSIAVATLYLTSVAKAQTNCICGYVYSPVCGEDGQTYGNACEAGCAQVRNIHKICTKAVSWLSFFRLLWRTMVNVKMLSLMSAYAWTVMSLYVAKMGRLIPMTAEQDALM